MIVTILMAIIILTVISIKKNPLKKVKNVFDIYDNSSYYNLIGIVITVIIAFIIYLFKKFG
jgi:hypothetical protein